ncbi:putative D-cysteine desulfhydrase 1, mitochondrial [Selaginella moellendorffii]|uniref:putative D-cysteine desulfhydrase 1, mitochondrial n=1 Tax=Selaginella moellendorffii TaxID=88036 RepID=UPI000D1CD504|nr:putative D-cysteine desulfhydrase 1, mitochondrial [Selaginella moellendorffii]|eukprot:XP_024531771.1 putative D-cysteine desulfhydrase 1, mitochondrial [Selaginella moellendorffii]
MARASIDEKTRPPMLSKGAFSPPDWAKHLNPAPSSIYSLAQLPSPIHRWDLPNLPADTQVWIKRDDLTGMQLSGNKVRKLEFLLAEAKLQGADCVVTIGGIQSNHCRATAVAARYLDLDCYLILRTSKSLVNEDPGLVGNLLVERLVGARVELVSKEEYTKHGSEALGDMLVEKLRAQGRKPYLIPVGGSNSLGTWGYISAAQEIEQQIEAGTCPRFDEIVMACGSGGTTAGLALGNHLSMIKAKVHGYTVCDSPDYFYDYIQGLLDGLHAQVDSRDIVRLVDAKGLGYALSSTGELELVKEISEATGVILDPVYSGKALHGMVKDMVCDAKYWTGKKVLFIHTGGLLGMFDKLQQIQPLTGNWRRMQIM